MRNLFILFACVLFTPVMAQSDAFSKVYYDLNGSVGGRQIRLTADGNYAIAGYRNEKALVIKSDSTGMPLWNKATTDDGYSFNTLTATSDSGIIAAGRNLVAKFSANGETEWSYLLSDVNLNIISIALTSDNKLLLAGYHNVSTKGLTQACFIRMTQSGNIELSRFYQPDSNDRNKFKILLEHPDGGYIALGESTSASNDDHEGAWLCRLDTDGDPVWSRLYANTFDHANYFEGIGMVVDSTGITALLVDKYYMWGLTKLLRTDTSGEPVWVVNHDGEFIPFLDETNPVNSLIATGSGGYAFIISEYWYIYSQLMIINSNGAATHAYTIYSTANDLLVTPQSDFVILGMGPMLGLKETNSFPHIGLYRVDTISYNSSCVAGGTAIGGITSLQNVGVTISQNVNSIQTEPGPVFTDAIFDVKDGCVDYFENVSEPAPVSYSLVPNPADCSVRLVSSTGNFSGQTFSVEIFDARGIKTALLSRFNPVLSSIETASLPEGIYLVRLSNAKVNIVLKMMVRH